MRTRKRSRLRPAAAFRNMSPRAAARRAAVALPALLLAATMIAAIASPAAAQRATMRERVYEKLSQAEAHASADEFGKAIEKLDDVKKTKDLSPYEKAQLYTAYGFVYFSQDRIGDAVKAYETVLEQPGLPEALATGTLYTLAQLNFQQERYEQCIA
ncbi:MAG: hypothetical protein HKN12_00035, partial [Gemmatimonadetes bacterium]|nr:hypothetical protein [Gemmatimonadota bacterium]